MALERVPSAKRYRLYIDESGDHTFSQVDHPNHRYLGLLGIWFRVDSPYTEFACALNQLKETTFGLHPDEPRVCLHRKDIVERRGIFGRLQDPLTNLIFCDGLQEVIKSARFCMACVVIDKASHQGKTYRELFHPYHYCVAALLERYAGWLSFKGAEGDVMAESRGKKEDQELIQAYENTIQKGTRFHSAQKFQKVLTSKKIKLKKKEDAIAGLELADLLAYPFKREMIAERAAVALQEDFSSVLLNAARSKINCQVYNGRIAGYGKVWLD
jgi:hypothetical protein